MTVENISVAKMDEARFRVTRARAKALGTSEGLAQKPPRPVPKRTTRAGIKRKTSDENKPVCLATSCSENRRRAVLSDVSNILQERSQVTCSNAVKIQTKKQLNGCPIRKSLKEDRSALTQVKQGENVKVKNAEGILKVKVESSDKVLRSKNNIDQYRAILMANQCKFTSQVKMEKTVGICASESLDEDKCNETDARPIEQSSRGSRRIHSHLMKDEKSHVHSVTPTDPEIVDIDANQKDPQMCSLYAQDIYCYRRVNELNCRPSADYMDKVQRDITRSMRSILIDWLVEVSEEYKLVPDTLYLTVNLIDRFLSCNYVEKQRLQLLGVTCMLIASKYEEISPHRVEEFCFITDYTYTKEEVVKMESEVLNLLCFKLTVPTIKTFLRRYIQAAQATSENPSLDVEYLANYLAELTLLEYTFLKFLPSLIAASAVLLARWILDKSEHPWNPTLEHYTSYKIMDLKHTVVAIEELQIKAKDSVSNSIREKYRQQKFNRVADLSSSKAVETLFSS